MENLMDSLFNYFYNTVKSSLLRKLTLSLMVLCTFSLLLLCSNAISGGIETTPDSLPTNKIYLGAFGGIGYFNNPNIDQTGTVFFSPDQGGTLFVHANGHLNDSHVTGIWGGHIGYEWAQLQLNNSQWGLIPGVEIEGYYLRDDLSGHLLNPTPRIPEHTFQDSFTMNSGVFLANSVWSFAISSMDRVRPYIGGGIGAAIISLSNADSAQVSPFEPGVNHFNSDTRDSDTTFAAQAKAGLRFNITNNWRLLAEYRLLYLSSAHYTFGATQYPTHAPTTRWSTGFGGMYNNMGLIGVEYSF